MPSNAARSIRKAAPLGATATSARSMRDIASDTAGEAGQGRAGELGHSHPCADPCDSAPQRADFPEAGAAFVVSDGWYGCSRRAGTPANIVGRLNAEINAAVANVDVRRKAETTGLQLCDGSAGEFSAFIASETRTRDADHQGHQHHGRMTVPSGHRTTRRNLRQSAARSDTLRRRPGPQASQQRGSGAPSCAAKRMRYSFQ